MPLTQNEGQEQELNHPSAPGLHPAPNVRVILQDGTKRQ
jgi:hypothetical protein